MKTQKSQREGGSECGNDIPSFQVKEARVACSPYSSIGEVRQLRRMYRPEEGPYVHVTFYLHNMHYKEKDWDADFWVQMVGDKVYEENVHIKVPQDEPTAKVTATFRCSETGTIGLGEWFVRLFQCKENKNVYQDDVAFKIVDLPPHYTQCFEFISFDLYRGEVADDSILHAKSQYCFKSRGLDSITLLYLAKNLLDKEWTPELVLMLFDETGRIVMQHVEEVQLVQMDEKNKCIYFMHVLKGKTRAFSRRDSTR